MSFHNVITLHRYKMNNNQANCIKKNQHCYLVNVSPSFDMSAIDLIKYRYTILLNNV